MTTIVDRFKSTHVYNSYRKWRNRRNQEREVRDWERRGRPLPPPGFVKRNTLKAYSQQYGLKIFVETGTYHGETIEAVKDIFVQIYSIELSRELFEKARDRFKSFKHIEIVHGDSGRELGRIVRELKQPALFYLDGHYSAGETARGEKDTPIFEELGHILSSSESRHVTVIDDARCFGSESSYPSLLELRRFVQERRKNVLISVEEDSIRIVPDVLARGLVNLPKQ